MLASPSLLLASPEFFWLTVACQLHVLYQNLLLRDDSCQRLLSCVVRAGHFSPWFPNRQIASLKKRILDDITSLQSGEEDRRNLGDRKHPCLSVPPIHC